MQQKIYQLESENAGLENAVEKMQDELINSKETEEEKANVVENLKDQIEEHEETIQLKDEKIKELETENS